MPNNSENQCNHHNRHKDQSFNMSTDEYAWKIFQRDTEAGRLLSLFYGVPPSTQRVTFPKIKRRRRLSNTIGANSSRNDDNEDAKGEYQTKGWKTTYCVHGWNKEDEELKEKERKQHRARALSMAVPRVGRAGGKDVQENDANAKVYQIPRRKTESTCKNTLKDYDFANKKYRPPHCHAISSESEKQRLNDIFGNRGGRCLPEDLTNPRTVSISMEKCDDVGSGKSRASQPDTLFDQIYQEILDRRQHQKAMEETGAGEATQEMTAHEIKIRLQQLKKLDTKRAIEVLHDLQK